jgi:hypothetical protein
MQKFVEVADNIGTANDWYAKCKREQIPYVVVEKRTKYATVRWDYISFHPSVDELITTNHDKYVDELKGIFNRYCNPKSRYEISGGLVDFVDLEVDKARLAANELYDVAIKIVSRE